MALASSFGVLEVASLGSLTLVRHLDAGFQAIHQLLIDHRGARQDTQTECQEQTDDRDQVVAEGDHDSPPIQRTRSRTICPT